MKLNALYPPTSALKLLGNNPYLNAAVIKVDWSSFDSGTGKYDFSATDAAIAPWVAAGKKVALVLWAVSNSAAGQYGNASTPQYIWNALGSLNYCNLTTQAGVQRIPNYEAPIYGESYQKAFAALAQHYSGKVDYIRVGLGHGGETIPGANWQTGLPKSWGITVTSWMAYLHGMLQFMGTLKGAPLMVGITPMGSPSTQVPDYVASLAAGLGIAFGSQGLESSDLTAQVTTANWLGNFKEYPKVGHELQTIGLSCPSGSNCPGNDGLTGPLPPLLIFAKANLCTICEIYYDDWRLAFDPNYPGYKQYGAAYAAAIKAVAS
jgi:hypothetical protein